MNRPVLLATLGILLAPCIHGQSAFEGQWLACGQLHPSASRVLTFERFLDQSCASSKCRRTVLEFRPDSTQFNMSWTREDFGCPKADGSGPNGSMSALGGHWELREAGAALTVVQYPNKMHYTLELVGETLRMIPVKSPPTP